MFSDKEDHAGVLLHYAVSDDRMVFRQVIPGAGEFPMLGVFDITLHHGNIMNAA